jgi:hypothetical protein
MLSVIHNSLFSHFIVLPYKFRVTLKIKLKIPIRIIK